MSSTSTATRNYTWKIFSELQIVVGFSAKKSQDLL